MNQGGREWMAGGLRRAPGHRHNLPFRLQVEQLPSISTITDSTVQELAEWNAKYREKFGFVFMICASGRTAHEVLAELKRRYANRPIVELEGAAQEELKITELRLAKLFSSETAALTTLPEGHISQLDKATVCIVALLDWSH